ncbi:MAG: LemA family protein [Clostridia bacterium]
MFTLLNEIGIGAIIGIVVALAVVIGIIAFFISYYNQFVKLKVKISEAESGIDVALTKRYDLLTKQKDTVKGYAKHEKETLTEVVAMRSGMTAAEKDIANSSMNQLQKDINFLVEKYPDLKASENFKTLQYSISDVEEHLQASRRTFNANVSLYNRLVLSFPSNIIASIFHFAKIDFFEAEEPKKADVKMDF